MCTLFFTWFAVGLCCFHALCILTSVVYSTLFRQLLPTNVSGCLKLALLAPNLHNFSSWSLAHFAPMHILPIKARFTESFEFWKILPSSSSDPRLGVFWPWSWSQIVEKSTLILTLHSQTRLCHHLVVTCYYIPKQIGTTFPTYESMRKFESPLYTFAWLLVPAMKVP